MRDIKKRLTMLGTRALLVLMVCGVGLLSSWAWEVKVDGTANGVDEARAVALDSAGHVIAAGYAENTGAGKDFTVVTYSATDGTVLWRREINGSGNTDDMALAVAVDTAGHVIAAGYLTSATTGRDFTVIKFSGTDGTELWRQEINGSADGDDVALAVRVSAAGDVIAAGSIKNAGTSSDFLVVKFSGTDGTELWRAEINGAANGVDEATAVALDRAGDVFAAGHLHNTDRGDDFTVVKLSGSDGTELWRGEITGTVDGVAAARAITVDRAGNVIAAGSLSRATGADFAVVKFSGGDGTELWRREINGTAMQWDQALAVTVDSQDEVFAAGRVRNTGSEEDFAVVKLSGADGTELWRREINGTADGVDEAHTLAVDAAGDVIAAGYIRNNSTREDFIAVKLSGADGTELWRREINDTGDGYDEASSVAVDAAGDVIAAGLTAKIGSGSDFLVTKLSGADGTERWHKKINGTLNNYTAASTIAVDGAEDVWAADQACRLGPGHEVTGLQLGGVVGIYY